MVALTSLPFNTLATVHSLETSLVSRTHLMELGIVKGTPIKIVRQAPFGGPFQINITGAHIVLRKEAAKSIFVEVEDHVKNG
jgi:ferrous iron transport protein A